jgi:hypothetical protein
MAALLIYQNLNIILNSIRINIRIVNVDSSIIYGGSINIPIINKINGKYKLILYNLSDTIKIMDIRTQIIINVIIIKVKLTY